LGTDELHTETRNEISDETGANEEGEGGIVNLLWDDSVQRCEWGHHLDLILEVIMGPFCEISFGSNCGFVENCKRHRELSLLTDALENGPTLLTPSISYYNQQQQKYAWNSLLLGRSTT
jgi:hypothetical protein